MLRILRMALLGLGVSAAATPLRAQTDGSSREPPRPALHASMDTADPRSYYVHGTRRLREWPQEAADAFYWASRLDPTLAEPFYAQLVALLLADRAKLVHFVEGQPDVSGYARAADSLYALGFARDPFVFRDLDDLLLYTYVLEWRQAGRRIAAVQPGARPPGVRDWPVQHPAAMRDLPPRLRAWIYYGMKRFDDALQMYDVALEGGRDRARLHADKAHVLVLTGDLHAAEREVRLALQERRARDDRPAPKFQETEAFYENLLGQILERTGRTAEAREAYVRALAGDRTLQPAHVRLATLAFEDGDTATALDLLAQAVAILPDDAVLLWQAGALLVLAGQQERGIPRLRRAIEIEPHFASPYFMLAYGLDVAGSRVEALAVYTAFLERAHRQHSQRPAALRRVDALRIALQAEDARP